MHPHDIVFALNDKERIVIELGIPFEEVPCYCLQDIFFVQEKQKYCLAYYGLDDNIKRFQNLLVDALTNKLQLHESITRDIGMLENIEQKYDRRNPNTYNYTWKGSPDLVYEKKQNYLSWIGYRYQLWAYDNLATWIYNNNDGAIIFEITRRYPYMFTKNKKMIKMSFRDWMKSYNPLFISTISPEVTQEWLKKTQYIVDFMDARLTEAGVMVDDTKEMT